MTQGSYYSLQMRRRLNSQPSDKKDDTVKTDTTTKTDTKKEDTSKVKTGDNAAIVPLVTMMIISGCALAYVLVRRKRNN